MPMKKSKSEAEPGVVVMAISFDHQATTPLLSASVSSRPSADHRRGLSEQHLALLVGVDAGLGTQLEADRLALHDGGTLADGFLEPLPQVREVLDLLAEILEAHDPRPDRHVGDRVVARDTGAVGEPLVQHAEQAVDLVAVAILPVL